MHEATAYVKKEDLEYWEKLLAEPKVDYSKYSIPKFTCVFFTSVEFDDGYTADIKVCSDTPESGSLWTEMVVYNKEGVQEYLSGVSDHLEGEWFAGEYKVYVEMDPFDQIHAKQKAFVEMVRRELLHGVTSEYAGKIAEEIAKDVAIDIAESADVDGWNNCDVSLGIGRVILKSIGVEV